MYQDLKEELIARGVVFAEISDSWVPTLLITRPGGGVTTVEVEDWGEGHTPEIAVSNDGKWPTRFHSLQIAAGTIALLSRCP